MANRESKNPEWGEVSNANLMLRVEPHRSLRRSSGALDVCFNMVPRVCTRGYHTRLLRSQSQLFSAHREDPVKSTPVWRT
jgi:hypothetical protein